MEQKEESRWGKDELLESRSQMNRKRTFTLKHQHKHVPRRLHSSELPSNSSQHPNISIGPFTKHWAWLQCSGSAPFPDADPDAGGGATLSDGHCSTTFYLDSLACSCCKETCFERREGEGLDPQKLDPDVMQRHSVYINMLFNYHANQLSFLSESCNISNVTTTFLV